MYKNKAGYLLLALILPVFYSDTSFAAQCGSRNDAYLDFLGKTNRKSLWLSILSYGGNFELRSPQNTEDSWSSATSHSKLSISGSSSNGNGESHHLYDVSGSKDVLLCSQNQKDAGFDFDYHPGLIPPIIGWPGNPIEPGEPVHPIAPGQPVHPIAPGQPVHPIAPGQPVHPIAPGQPVHPIEPGEPVHPIEPGPPVLPVEPDIDNAKRSRDIENKGVDKPIICPERAEDLGKVLLDERYKHCFEDTKAGPYESLPSITPGREYDAGKLWNVWADARMTRRNDSRFSRVGDIDAQSGIFAAGLDKRLDENFVAGVMVNFENSGTDAFNSVIDRDSSGFNIGPYIGYRLTDRWSMDLSMLYGWYDNSLDINSGNLLTVNTDYDSEKLSIMLNFTGDYLTDVKLRIKPKIGLQFSRTETDNHTIDYIVSAVPGSFYADGETSRTASASIGSVFSKQYFDETGLITEPSLELSADYQFDRYFEGSSLMNSGLDKWSGEIRAGVSRQLSDVTFIKADIGYTSIGQDDIDAWDVGLFMSYQF